MEIEEEIRSLFSCVEFHDKEIPLSLLIGRLCDNMADFRKDHPLIENNHRC